MWHLLLPHKLPLTGSTIPAPVWTATQTHMRIGEYQKLTQLSISRIWPKAEGELGPVWESERMRFPEKSGREWNKAIWGDACARLTGTAAQLPKGPALRSPASLDTSCSFVLGRGRAAQIWSSTCVTGWPIHLQEAPVAPTPRFCAE